VLDLPSMQEAQAA